MIGYGVRDINFDSSEGGCGLYLSRCVSCCLSCVLKRVVKVMYEEEINSESLLMKRSALICENGDSDMEINGVYHRQT